MSDLRIRVWIRVVEESLREEVAVLSVPAGLSRAEMDREALAAICAARVQRLRTWGWEWA